MSHRVTKATPRDHEIAGRALHELEESYLVVVLQPAPDPHFDGHKIRVAQNRNPKWYREFVAGHWGPGRRGCSIKRYRVIRALNRVYVRGIIYSRGYEAKLLKKLQDLWED